MRDVLVVGAGIAGLTAARTLQRAGRSVVVLDKGRRPGGRLATRRLAEGVAFDHGAQFFTVREPAFAALRDEWVKAGVAHEWCRGFADQTGLTQTDGHPRYSGTGGMNRLAQHLAAGLEIRSCQLIRELEWAAGRWTAYVEGAEPVQAQALVVTPPVPQALRLFTTELAGKAGDELARITYEPCAALLVLLSADAPLLPKPGGVQLPNGHPLIWLADNRAKRTTVRPGAVTIHACARFTEQTWNEPAEQVQQALLKAAEPWLGRPEVETYQLHRWRYSKPLVCSPQRCLRVPGEAPLVFAGDAFGEARVEGAALSGMAAAIKLLEG